MSYLNSSLSFLRTCPVWGGCFSPLFWSELSLLWVEDYPGRTKGKEWGSKTNEIRRWKKDYRTQHKQDRNWLKRWERGSVCKTLCKITEKSVFGTNNITCCQFPIDTLGDKRLRIAVTLLKQINFNIINKTAKTKAAWVLADISEGQAVLHFDKGMTRRAACLSEISGKLKFLLSLLCC